MSRGDEYRHAGSAHEAPEIGDAAAQQDRKPRRLGRDVHKDGSGEKNEEDQDFEQVNPDGRLGYDGNKVGLAKVRLQLYKIAQVDGAGNLLRRKTVVQVRGQPTHERYGREQAEG